MKKFKKIIQQGLDQREVYDNEILNFYANSNGNHIIVATLSPDHTFRKKALHWRSFAFDAYILDVTCINDTMASGARSIEPNLKGHAGMDYSAFIPSRLS